MMIVKGYGLGTGEDQYEEVVDVEEIVEIWSYEDFCNIVEDIENSMYEEDEE